MWRRLVYWQGAYGYSRLLITNYAVQPASVPGTLDAVIQNFSNAVIAQVAEGTVTALSGTPIVATYPSVTQIARLTCLDTSNMEFTIAVPAPILAMFEADTITVKPTALATILGAAATDQLVNPSTGLLVNAIVSGVLNGPANPGVQLTGV